MARREEELNGPPSGPRPTIPPTPVDWAKMSERFERDREAGLPPFGERDERAQGQPGPEGDLADPRSVAADLLRGRGPAAPQPPQPPQAPPAPQPPQAVQPPRPPQTPAPQGPPPAQAVVAQAQPPAPPTPPAPPAAPAPARPQAPARAERSGVPSIAPEDRERFRERWPEIKATFVDDPRASVRQADQLVDELVQLLTRRLGEERARIERSWAGEVSTEDLRQALHGYQVLFERLT